MKAIQVKQPGGPEAMELVELPVPEPKANEAVVKLAASGVNFIDVYLREGRYKVAPAVCARAGRRGRGHGRWRRREVGEERRSRGLVRACWDRMRNMPPWPPTAWCRFLPA